MEADSMLSKEVVKKKPKRGNMSALDSDHAVAQPEPPVPVVGGTSSLQKTATGAPLDLTGALADAVEGTTGTDERVNTHGLTVLSRARTVPVLPVAARCCPCLCCLLPPVAARACAARCRPLLPVPVPPVAARCCPCLCCPLPPVAARACAARCRPLLPVAARCCPCLCCPLPPVAACCCPCLCCLLPPFAARACAARCRPLLPVPVLPVAASACAACCHLLLPVPVLPVAARCCPCLCRPLPPVAARACAARCRPLLPVPVLPVAARCCSCLCLRPPTPSVGFQEVVRLRSEINDLQTTLKETQEWALDVQIALDEKEVAYASLSLRFEEQEALILALRQQIANTANTHGAVVNTVIMPTYDLQMLPRDHNNVVIIPATLYQDHPCGKKALEAFTFMTTTAPTWKILFYPSWPDLGEMMAEKYAKDGVSRDMFYYVICNFPAKENIAMRKVSEKRSNYNCDIKLDRFHSPAFPRGNVTCSSMLDSNTGVRICSKGAFRCNMMCSSTLASTGGTPHSSASNDTSGSGSKGGGRDSLSLAAMKHIAAVASAKGCIGKSTTAGVPLRLSTTPPLRLSASLPQCISAVPLATSSCSFRFPLWIPLTPSPYPCYFPYSFPSLRVHGLTHARCSPLPPSSHRSLLPPFPQPPHAFPLFSPSTASPFSPTLPSSSRPTAAVNLAMALIHESPIPSILPSPHPKLLPPHALQCTAQQRSSLPACGAAHLCLRPFASLFLPPFPPSLNPAFPPPAVNLAMALAHKKCHPPKFPPLRPFAPSPLPRVHQHQQYWRQWMGEGRTMGADNRAWGAEVAGAAELEDTSTSLPGTISPHPQTASIAPPPATAETPPIDVAGS
ncbi:unnamed protein product [Closterium sp. NIES-65]|nr:unnamed protein product [Closterium sp. NIES-65]